MTLEALIARAHRMDERAWACHANPWSVWTRIPILPALALTAWSREWIGAWALLPAAMLLGWTWANPRAFAPPASTDNWASRAVIGERLWLSRPDHPVPPHHRLLPHLLNALAALGGVALAWGLIRLDGVLALSGLATALGAKMWFMDRMVWLTHDMRDDPRMRDWTRPVS